MNISRKMIFINYAEKRNSYFAPSFDCNFEQSRNTTDCVCNEKNFYRPKRVYFQT